MGGGEGGDVLTDKGAATDGTNRETRLLTAGEEQAFFPPSPSTRF